MIVDNGFIIGYSVAFFGLYSTAGALLSSSTHPGNHLFPNDPRPSGGALFIDYHWGKIGKTVRQGYIMTVPHPW